MDSDTIEFLALAAMVWAPVLVWSLKSGRKRRRKGEEPEPICGCEHNLAFHTSEGICKAQRQRWLGTDSRGNSQYDIVDCTCQQYVGPIPMISPQIMRELSMPQASVEPYSQDK